MSRCETDCIKKTLLYGKEPGDDVECIHCNWVHHCRLQMMYCRDDFIDKNGMVI